MSDHRGLVDIEPAEIEEITHRIRGLAALGEPDTAIAVRLNLKASAASVLRRRAGIPPGKTKRGGIRQGCTAPTELNRDLARLLEAAGLGRVRKAGVGVIRRMEGTNHRVDRPIRLLMSAGWVMVGSDGVYRPTEAGDEALKAYRDIQAERHGLVVERCAPRARPVGR